MALPKLLQKWVEQQSTPESASEFEPTHPDELIGMEIIFEKNNRGLNGWGEESGWHWTEEGWQEFKKCFKGEVIDWIYYTGRNMPRGMYLIVRSDDFNAPVGVHESRFVCYSHEAEATAQMAAAS